MLLVRTVHTQTTPCLRPTPLHAQGLVAVEDPRLFDTRLTPEGQRQALKLSTRISKMKTKPELLVVSPLTRALQTSSLAFDATLDVPRVVQPLAAERVWHSSDVGRSPEELSEEFPDYSFSDLRPIWWYNAGSSDPQRIVVEPDESFFGRMDRLRDWLLARPEKHIALVSHWGVLNSLTGRDFDNCELYQCHEKDLWVRRLSAF